MDLYRLVHGRMRPVETKKGCRPTRQPSRILVQVESRFRFEPRRRDTNTHAKEAFRGRLPTQRVSSALDVVSRFLNYRFRPLNLHVPVTQFLRVNSRNFLLSFSPSRSLTLPTRGWTLCAPSEGCCLLRFRNFASSPRRLSGPNAKLTSSGRSG